MDRHKLTELIESDDGKNWWSPALFAHSIRAQLPSELQVISPPPIYRENYNCFVFVFGLQDSSEFLNNMNPIQEGFIKYLLDQNVLEVTDDPHVGDMVFYTNESDTITHAGLMRSPDTVMSKWMWGPTIIHKLWDVPSSFGDSVFFCKPIDSIHAKKLYREYKETDAVIEPIR